MAIRIRNDSWKNYHDLEDILRKYVRKGLQPEEILDFVSRDFSLGFQIELSSLLRLTLTSTVGNIYNSRSLFGQ